MNLKYIIKNSFLFFSMLAMLAIVSGCNPDDVEAPSIEFIRYTDSIAPVSYANLGQTIAIVGNNLSTVKEVTFNGKSGVFKTTMVSNTSVVVMVSKETPFMGDEATNEVKIITDGGEAVFILEIAPPAPEVNAVSPEYAGAEAVVEIQGSYFYNISEVFFGDKQAQILDVSPTYIKVKVPEDCESEQIKVTSSKSGEGSSDFLFGLEDGVIQLNWGDIWPLNGAWWNSSNDGPDDAFTSIGVPYKYVEGTFGPTWWTLDGGITFDANASRKGNPATKVMKFEYALIGDAPWMQFSWRSLGKEYNFLCKDLLPTAGEWMTYSIPMTNFILGDTGAELTQEAFENEDPSVKMQYALVNSGTADITVKYAMTNIRIVDK